MPWITHRRALSALFARVDPACSKHKSRHWQTPGLEAAMILIMRQRACINWRRQNRPAVQFHRDARHNEAAKANVHVIAKQYKCACGYRLVGDRGLNGPVGRDDTQRQVLIQSTYRSETD
jgi:hypothetical protein